MKLRGYAVFDSAVKAFIAPFFLQSDAEAVRVFRECANDPKHMFCRHAEDYSLFSIGDFDDVKGEFRSWVPTSLGFAAAFREPVVNVSSSDDPKMPREVRDTLTRDLFGAGGSLK